MQRDNEQGTAAETISIVTGLAALQQSVRDEFFAARMGEWTKEFLESYLQYRLRASESPTNVAQYGRAHLVSVARLLDLIDELAYLRLGEATPLSICRFKLMRYKLSVLRSVQTLPQRKPPAEPERTQVKPSVLIPESRMNRNSELILDFIKAVPRVRTKEVVEQFSALSERTVKRSLRELTHLGLLKKTSENKAMYYSLA